MINCEYSDSVTLYLSETAQGLCVGLFLCLKKRHAETNKFEIILSKGIILKQKFTTIDFTREDRDLNT